MARPQDVRIRFIGQDRTRRAFRAVTSSLLRIRTLFAGLATGGAVIGFARAGQQAQLLQDRLRALGAGSIRLQEVIDLSNRVGISFGEASLGVTRFVIAGRQLRLTAAETLQLTQNIAALGRLGGASAQETASGVRQLGQALASGRLQGDELRSILENLPLVAQAIAQGLGVSVGELKELGRQGALTSQTIAAILLNVEGLEDRIRELRPTIDSAFARLGTSVVDFAQLVGITEFVANRLGNVSEAVEFVNDRIRDWQGLTVDVNREVRSNNRQYALTLSNLQRQQQLAEATAEAERQRGIEINKVELARLQTGRQLLQLQLERSRGRVGRQARFGAVAFARPRTEEERLIAKFDELIRAQRIRVLEDKLDEQTRLLEERTFKTALQ